ncbi:phage tail assembly protein [Anaerosporobacter faecicola]|uniref:phage tail assembly protein n=1 Tax=Anaerosporobacter faecicola TaxID=2718714 RepID=UPI00143C5D78|nr:phage tail assembly protein [Anaerosporobacter faecicola]
MKKEELEVTEDTEVVEAELVDDNMIMTFKKPYTFEGKEYREIDLSGLDNLTGKDMIAAQKVLDRNGSFSFIPEMSLQYACVLASRATKLPIEFFEGMHPRESIRLKNKVTGFLYGQD